MSYAVSLISLALIWAAITGNLTPGNLMVGALLAFMVMLVSRHRGTFATRAWTLLTFVVAFIIELVLANLRVARDVLSPRPRIAPGVVAIPTHARTDAELTIIANLISLTPGTLTLDISDDRTVLYLHSMYLDDLDELADSVTNGVERRTLELLR